MGTIRLTARRVMAATGISVAVALAGGAGVHAGSAPAPATLAGVVSCDATTGHQLVAWTFTNSTGQTVVINSGTVDATGLSTGSAIDATASFTPTSLDLDATAAATTAVSGDATGDYHLVVNYKPGLAVAVDLDQEVVLPGGCVASTTTSPSTTAVDNGSGGLPPTGSQAAEVAVAAGVALGLGALLLLARRRRPVL